MFTPPITLLLSALAAVSGALTIAANYRNNRRMQVIFKPLTMVFIIAIALITAGDTSDTYRTLIVLGLLASITGDVLLLFETRFTQGLISFLVAHLFYIAAFTLSSSDTPAIWYGVPFVLYGAIMLWRLWPHLGKLRAPVMVYVGVILIMAWQAANRWVVDRDRDTLLALVGAYLFVMSDSVLSFERFRGTFRHAPFWVLSTYYAAQWLIALSI